MSYDLLIMEGEGIGPEIISEGVRVLKKIRDIFNLDIKIYTYEVGISCYHKYGLYLTNEAKEHCKQAKRSNKAAILFGAVSGEPIGILRKSCDLFANIRPVYCHKTMVSTSPLRAQIISGTDFCIVRELISDIYYGKAANGITSNQIRWASQEMYYNEDEIRKITKQAFELACRRRKQVTLVHKSNVIKGVFGLWEDVFKEISRNYPQIICEDLLIDNMAMQLVLRPTTFDVILCSNLFGDILSDIGAGIIGSIGMLPSMSMNLNGFALYESIGGTSPDIAGKQEANPISTILSVALFCRYTLNLEKAAIMIEQAVYQTLLTFRTPDILSKEFSVVTTKEMGNKIIENIDHTQI